MGSLLDFFRMNRAAEGASGPGRGYPVTKSEIDWRKVLTPEQYHVLREHGTERPGSSPLEHDPRVGTFFCAACDQPLYRSDTKFDSGCGWPSFFEALPGAVETSVDNSLGMRRVEVHCSRCGGHLGHVFNDGPRPTGQRFCMNGVAMKFTPDAT
jgi:peptide-methionine (R)-S-oxide reductase